MMRKINLFISYSHEDKDYLKELKVYLNEKTCPDINIWDDGKITPGTEWDDEIKKRLNESQIVLLLISQYFLNSNYINQTELKHALEKHDQKKCRVIPIFTRNCNLEKYPQITKLQGLPNGMKFLSDVDKTDSHYREIQDAVNEVSNEIITDINLLDSIYQNETKSTRAKTIEELRNKRKIFLSIPDSDEGKKRRNGFINQVEGKIKYEGWPYVIVPGIEEAKELSKKPDEERRQLLYSLINESLYSIQIIISENDMNGSEKMQYDLSKKYCEISLFHKSIIWLLHPEIRGKLDKEVSMNPVIIGTDYEKIFELIESLDVEKEKIIEGLKKPFSPNKKIFMFYDFTKDHNSNLRIKLKSKIEENQNLVIKFNVPDAPLDKDKEDLEKCEGGCIFYGASDPQWFLYRQSILLDAGFTSSKAICIDEPEIDTKIERDVSKNAFITIKGLSELDTGVKSFLAGLLN